MRSTPNRGVDKGRHELSNHRSVERMDSVVVTILEKLQRRPVAIPRRELLTVIWRHQHVTTRVEYQHRGSESPPRRYHQPQLAIIENESTSLEQYKMKIRTVEGDLLDQDVEVIVNAWNRNIIPWWLLLPQGVSGAIKKRGGYGPFRELSRKGAIPLGGAVLTSAGKLPFRAIIHVAGISMWWRSSERSIRLCVANALRIAHEQGFASIAFPMIGAGTGGGDEETVLQLIQDELGSHQYEGEVVLVLYRRHGEILNSGKATADASLKDLKARHRRQKKNLALVCEVHPLILGVLACSIDSIHSVLFFDGNVRMESVMARSAKLVAQ